MDTMSKRAKITDRNMTDAELEQCIDKYAAIPSGLDEEEYLRRHVMVAPQMLWADHERLKVLQRKRVKRMQQEVEREQRKLEALERDIGMSRN
jgi:hypothetical protein